MGPSNDTDEAAFSLPLVVEEPCALYPGLEAFSNEYDADDYRGWVEQSNGDPLPAPLALYIHDGRSHARPPSAAQQLQAVEQELRLQGRLFDPDRSLQQLILAGSIASEWGEEHLERLILLLQNSFHLSGDGRSSWCLCLGAQSPIPASLSRLVQLGFAAARLEVAPGVDRTDTLASRVGMLREAGLQQIFLDMEPVVEWLDQLAGVLAATVPQRVRLGARTGAARADYAELLSQQGYRNIGLDWFVRPEDPLSQAQDAGRLHWSLLGYTALRDPDVIGIGPGALSSVGEWYGMNEPRWQRYRSLLAQDQLPVACGVELEPDDALRREIMHMILADACIRVSAIEEKWGIGFHRFFAGESAQLQAFERQGWVEQGDDAIRVLVSSRDSLTALCRLFDRRGVSWK
ncbi:MAG TPA: hypothetical protein ENK05_06600 [Gammaproteobacteria bacterium]|nr:hypothetical protein [Gammaproteobacteria bacterium]